MTTRARAPRSRASRAAAAPASKTAASAKGQAAPRKTRGRGDGAAPAAPPAVVPAGKPEKRKLVRDSFTIPADEYDLIAQLKKRAMALGREAKKSELLRAGLKALQDMADRALAATLEALPAVKTGRPKAKKPHEAKKPAKPAKRGKIVRAPKTLKTPPKTP